MIHLPSLIDDAQGVETVRALRWPDGGCCPACQNAEATKHGRDDTPPERQRDLGKSCGQCCDAGTATIVAGPHQPLRMWMLCLYGRGLTRSQAPMAKALDLHTDDGFQMTCQ
jgi:hypothetical protein